MMEKREMILYLAKAQVNVLGNIINIGNWPTAEADSYWSF